MTAPRLKIVYRKLKDLKPAEDNPRNIEQAVGPVMASIQAFGFRVPIGVKGNDIAAGHVRYEAARRLDMEEVPTVSLDDMTPEQLKAYRIADNKTAELAEWDETKLAVDMAELLDMGVDMADFGFSTDELDSLQAARDAAEVPGEPEHAPPANHISPDAKSVRVAIGKFVFFIGAAEYSAWADRVRASNDHNDGKIILDLSARLGMREAFEAFDKSKAPVVKTVAIGEIRSSPTQAARVRVRTRKP